MDYVVTSLASAASIGRNEERLQFVTMHAYIHACIHIHMHSYIHACIHAQAHTRIRTHTYMRDRPIAMMSLELGTNLFAGVPIYLPWTPSHGTGFPWSSSEVFRNYALLVPNWFLVNVATIIEYKEKLIVLYSIYCNRMLGL